MRGSSILLALVTLVVVILCNMVGTHPVNNNTPVANSTTVNDAAGEIAKRHWRGGGGHRGGGHRGGGGWGHRGGGGWHHRGGGGWGHRGGGWGHRGGGWGHRGGWGRGGGWGYRGGYGWGGWQCQPWYYWQPNYCYSSGWY